MIPQMVQKLVFMLGVMARVVILVKGACGVPKRGMLRPVAVDTCSSA